MSTTYRAVVHCDERKSGKCFGLVQVEGPDLSALNAVSQRVMDRGWLRGYGPEQTYDVCPGCQTPEQQQRVRETAYALARQPLNDKEQIDA